MNNQALQFQLHQMIDDFDAPNQCFHDKATIRPQLPEINDYEIKTQIISLVKQHKFYGLPTNTTWTTSNSSKKYAP